ncbi:hypothetical protein EVAR_23106_1 [Eumeta japonica]|uniref:Uncharacterized protein n=1 Tax=Eumeta variegata TaxID=151549 RepID=A0A4C1VMM8_EUMVA|nr:hypothetical protein EVAR_23106_1 [Eumeta japonica]
MTRTRKKRHNDIHPYYTFVLPTNIVSAVDPVLCLVRPYLARNQVALLRAVRSSAPYVGVAWTTTAFGSPGPRRAGVEGGRFEIKRLDCGKLRGAMRQSKAWRNNDND